jgi:hypothetical protein
MGICFNFKCEGLLATLVQRVDSVFEIMRSRWVERLARWVDGVGFFWGVGCLGGIFRDALDCDRGRACEVLGGLGSNQVQPIQSKIGYNNFPIFVYTLTKHLDIERFVRVQTRFNSLERAIKKHERNMLCLPSTN